MYGCRVREKHKKDEVGENSEAKDVFQGFILLSLFFLRERERESERERERERQVRERKDLKQTPSPAPSLTWSSIS